MPKTMEQTNKGNGEVTSGHFLRDLSRRRSHYFTFIYCFMLILGVLLGPVSVSKIMKKINYASYLFRV